ncbi:hypothetical protein F4808DRAFT_461950 [Astrocystis sublimbata]|nr:hypothetical protein F4808DRAFT_461950 [Astrocystis sublimbata]
MSSIPDAVDDMFPQPAIDMEETPPSSQSTTQSKQAAQPANQHSSSPKTPSPQTPTDSLQETEAEDSSLMYDSDGSFVVEYPMCESPSSTGKLSHRFPSRAASPTSPKPSTPTSSPRLYRTRSGKLATVAELKQRREREEEALDIVLKGIVISNEAKRASKRSIPMSLNESGRWRISSISEPWGP